MKTSRELLEQDYLNAKELMQIIPVSYIRALEYITETQEEMKQKNYFVPRTRPKVALTKLIRKKFGLWVQKKRFNPDQKEISLIK